LIEQLDRGETSFASTTQDVMGRTTEGGEQTTYTRDGVRQIVEQRFYKETGRSIARIYYTSGKPFALVVLVTEYAVPLSADNSAKVQSTEERIYFPDDNSVVCSWMLNGKPQPIDDNTVESVKSYLAGVL
jgi:YD repeat-containing protein